ncbi:MAG: S8 family serine peptidase [Limnoraphis sp.]
MTLPLILREIQSSPPKPSIEVDGSLRIIESSLPGCKQGYYDVRGQFNKDFTQFTLNEAKGAEGCFSSVPVQLFTVPGLKSGGKPIEFKNNAGPGGNRITGEVSRVVGSFTSKINYPDAGDNTFAFLALNSKNLKVRGFSEEDELSLKGQTASETKGSEALPERIPNPVTEDQLKRDTRPDSDTSGLVVVQNQLEVVFSDDATVEEIQAAIKATGAKIISSTPGVSVVTLEIPNTGDLNGIDRVEKILSNYPFVVTTVPVIMDEAPQSSINEFPEPRSKTLSPFSKAVGNLFGLSHQLISKSSSQNLQTNSTAQNYPKEFIPQYLKVTKAVILENDNINYKRPIQLGSNPPNLFVVDYFSEPMNQDVNLRNPVHRQSMGFVIAQNYKQGFDWIQDQFKRWLNLPQSNDENLFNIYQPVKESFDLFQGDEQLLSIYQSSKQLISKKLSYSSKLSVDKIFKNTEDIIKDQLNHENIAFFSSIFPHDTIRDCSIPLFIRKKPNCKGWIDYFKNMFYSRVYLVVNGLQNHNCFLARWIVNELEDIADKVKNSHGFLVSGIMAARSNGNNIIGMYPSQNAPIFALNAKRIWEDNLLQILKEKKGNHVVNFSGGINSVSASEEDKINRRKSQAISSVNKIRDRNLENRVLLVQSAGNDNKMKNNKRRELLRGEYNGKWASAGLLEDLNRGKISPLKNVLVVESLDVTGKGCSVKQDPDSDELKASCGNGDYAPTSNIISNQKLAVRAFGETTTNCPLDISKKGFPALTSGNRIECKTGGGTSSAAPQVAGLAAWLWSWDSTLTAPELADLIRKTQDNFQLLDENGEPKFDSKGKPIMSSVTAINVEKALSAIRERLGVSSNDELALLKEQKVSSKFELEVLQKYKQQFICVNTQEFSKAKFEEQSTEGLLTGELLKEMAKNQESCVNQNEIGNVDLSNLTGVVHTIERQGNRVILVVGVGLRSEYNYKDNIEPSE